MNQQNDGAYIDQDLIKELGKAARKVMVDSWIKCGGKPEDFPEPGPFYISCQGFPTIKIGSSDDEK